MLDMDLIQGKQALKAEFRTSLAADLLHTMALVMDAPWHEGFDGWVYATHAAFPPTLTLKVLLTLSAINWQSFICSECHSESASEPLILD